MQIRTRGGESESEQKELTVRPAGLLLASIVITTVTPEAKRLRADRNNSSQTGISNYRENRDAGC